MSADDSLVELDAAHARLTGGVWDFEIDHADAIAAHWADAVARKPASYNGLILAARPIPPGQVRGAISLDLFAIRYASLLYWRSLGWPALGAAHTFTTMALRASCGRYLLGRMAPHTSNAGLLYFPGGNLDPEDADADGHVDLEAAALRELHEETGLSPSDVTLAPGWTLVHGPSRLGLVKTADLAMPAEAARERILSAIAAQPEPELCDIDIAEPGPRPRGPDMLAFAARFLDGRR